MKYLITSSLLDGYDWLKSCPKSWKQSAMERFAAMIRREETEKSPAMQRGIDFENLVCKNSNYGNEDFYKYAKDFWGLKGVPESDSEIAAKVSVEVASICNGGEQQVKVMRDISFGNDDYHLFGYADVVFPKKIIDIKTTGHYKEGYSYVKRSQHYIYSLCTGINTFEYLVADYKDSSAPKSLHRIEFELNQEENMWVLENRIKKLFGFLLNNGLFNDYCDKYTALHDDNKIKEAL